LRKSKTYLSEANLSCGVLTSNGYGRPPETR
jgi:hypothetical protein